MMALILRVFLLKQRSKCMSIDIVYIAFDPKKADLRLEELVAGIEDLKKNDSFRSLSHEEEVLKDLLDDSESESRDSYLERIDLLCGAVERNFIEEGKVECEMVEVMSQMMGGEMISEPNRAYVVQALPLIEERWEEILEVLAKEFNSTTKDMEPLLGLYYKNIEKVGRALIASEELLFITEVNGEIGSTNPEVKEMLNKRLEMLRDKFSII